MTGSFNCLLNDLVVVETHVVHQKHHFHTNKGFQGMNPMRKTEHCFMSSNTAFDFINNAMTSFHKVFDNLIQMPKLISKEG